jgi:hypothetical protein
MLAARPFENERLNLSGEFLPEIDWWISVVSGKLD